MGRLSVEALRSLSELGRLREELDALDAVARRPSPFATVEYIEAFLAHDEYGTREDELLALVAREDGHVVGWLPLRKHRARAGRVPFGRIGVLVSHDTDRPCVVARREDEERVARAFWDYLLRRERGWSLVELAMQDDTSALRHVPPLAPWRFWTRRFENMPVSCIPMHGSLEAYYDALHTNERHNVRRSIKRTLDAGRVECACGDDPRATRELLGLYLDVERRSWKEAARAGVRRDPRRVAFFEALCDARQPMHLGVDLLLLDDLPIAGNVTGAYGDVLYGLEMCFDEDYEALACGRFASLLVIRRAVAMGAREINMNGNYAYYKARVGAEVTPTFAVQVFRVGSVPWLKARAGDALRALRKREEKPPEFNPERRAHEEHAPIPPPRERERSEARATLAALEARGAKVERFSGADLAQPILAKAKKSKEAA